MKTSCPARSPTLLRAGLALLPLVIGGSCGRGLWDDPGALCGARCFDGGRDAGGAKAGAGGAAGAAGAGGWAGAAALPDASTQSDASARSDASVKGDASAPVDASAPRDASAPVDASTPVDASAPRDASAPVDASARNDGHEPADARGADAASSDAASRPDGASHPDGAAATGGTAAGQFLLASLPCASAAGPSTCTVTQNQSATLTVDGPKGAVYDLALHVRGVVETKAYPGGCQLGPRTSPPDPWVAGGLPGSDTRNMFRLSISSPAQTYYLNGPSKTAGTIQIDLQRTVHADAGATVTLDAISVKGTELANMGAGGQPVVVTGTTVPQPYNGQFVQVDIDSLQAETFPARDAGWALAFMGAQTVTVLDAPTLRPTDVTLEAWFEFDGFEGDYDTLIGKPYGSYADDSFAIWYQAAFNSGVAVHSPDNATSFMWSPVLGDWHHAAMTYDSATQQTVFYLDGIPSACDANGPPPVYDQHDIFIGADTDENYLGGYWIGALDEVRIFSRARTADQVWADMHADRLGPSEGLVAEWTFDDAAGQTAADSSGNGNTATLGLSASPGELQDPSWIPSTVP
jgi:hypothetical protein